MPVNERVDLAGAHALPVQGHKISETMFEQQSRCEQAHLQHSAVPPTCKCRTICTRHASPLSNVGRPQLACKRRPMEHRRKSAHKDAFAWLWLASARMWRDLTSCAPCMPGANARGQVQDFRLFRVSGALAPTCRAPQALTAAQARTARFAAPRPPPPPAQRLCIPAVLRQNERGILCTFFHQQSASRMAQTHQNAGAVCA